jgi:hypothetical protein
MFAMTVSAGHMLGDADATTTILSPYTCSVRVLYPGYLLCLTRSDYRRILNEVDDDEAQARILISISRAFHLDLSRPESEHPGPEEGFETKKESSGDGVNRVEILQSLAACFSPASFAFQESQVMGQQDKEAEDIFVVCSGNCCVSVDLVSVKKNVPTNDSSRRSPTRSQDRQGLHDRVNVANVGKNAVIGFAGIAGC